MVTIKPFHSISTPSINILIQWDPVYISTSYVVSQHSHIKICETLSHLSFPIVSSHTCSQSCWWPDHEWHCDYRSSSFSVAVYILFFPVCVWHFFMCFLIIVFIFFLCPPCPHVARCCQLRALSPANSIHWRFFTPYFRLFVVIGIGHHVCSPVKKQQGTDKKKKHKHLSNSPCVNELDLTEIAVPAN